MKHSVLILAHKNVEQLCRLVEYFEHDCDVYIHIDKKQAIGNEDERRLLAYPQVKLVSREYDVNWGGTSVLESEMHLLRMAVKMGAADYYHLISGQDYPTRPLECFLRFFEERPGKEFISYLHLPHPRWENNTFRRLQYFYPYDYAASHDNPRKWVWEQVKEQRDKGAKRPIPDAFDHLYGGSQWFSITRKAAETLLDYTDHHPQLYGQMWMTFAPEECYVATVLVNLMGKENIESWNHRFIHWKYENGNRPANLGCEHFHYLLENECLFARKFELPVSTPLLDRIDKYLLQDYPIKIGETGGWIYNGFQKYGYDSKFVDYVARMWCDVDARTGLDMGCGDGLYVAQWRSRGLSFAGYDANPSTEALSAMLLPQGDTPCGVADLTEDLEVDNKFDMVVCKDVLPYIPQELVPVALRNLAKLSARFIILSWNIPEELSMLPHRQVVESNMLAILAKEHFVQEKYMSANLRVIMNRKDCCVLIRHEQI